MKTRLLMLSVSLLLLAAPSFAGIYYVKTTGNDSPNNGLSWAAAFATLQKALSVVVPGDQIWVARGTYYPDEGGIFPNNDRNASFTMKNGLAIYGGFPNTGSPGMGQRNWTANPTILSGDIDKNNILDNNNAYHVIFNSFTPDNLLTSSAILDGFSIIGGNSDGGTGGGMHNYDSSPSLTNCTFSGNSATNGGGMGNFFSRPNLVNCSFSGNSANDGGGLYDYFSSSTLTNCTLSGNSAINGGGLYNYSSGASLTNCTLSANKATSNGGGMYSDESIPILTNCSFSGNKATSSSGGGMFYVFSNPILKNCIIWGNSSEIDVAVSTLNYANTLVKGVDLTGIGAGNFDGTNAANNPLFVTQPDFNAAPTTAGNLRLNACSPAINVGDNTANSTPKDLDNKNRKFGIIDLGAYEYQAQPFSIVASNSGNCTSVALSTKITSGTLAYAYTWVASGGGNFTSSSNSPTAFTPSNPPGNYSFTITVNDGVGCTATATTSTSLANPASLGTLSSNSPVTVGLVIDLKTSIVSSNYTWKGPDAWTSNLKDPSRGNAKVTMSGVYTLTVKGSNGCTGTNTISVQVVPKSTREAVVEDLSLEKGPSIDMDISAYPNPVTNILTVEVRLIKPSSLSLKLLNSIGQSKGTWKLEEVSTFHKTEIDLTSLTGGVYLLQAQAGKQKVVKRVVKIQD